MPNYALEMQMFNLPEERNFKLLKSEADSVYKLYRPNNEILYTSEVQKNSTNPTFETTLFKLGFTEMVPTSKFLVKVENQGFMHNDLIGEAEIRFPFFGRHPLKSAQTGAGNAYIECKGRLPR